MAIITLKVFLLIFSTKYDMAKISSGAPIEVENGTQQDVNKWPNSVKFEGQIDRLHPSRRWKWGYNRGAYIPILKEESQPIHLSASSTQHDDVIKWKHFPHYCPFVREIRRSPWIPLTKASDAELWCFQSSAPEQTVGQTIETLVIWDAIAPIMTSL